MSPSDAEASGTAGGVANLQPVWEGMEKEQKAWYWYDWANSAYVTTIATVLLSPYLISVAEMDACGKATGDGFTCRTNLDILGLAVSPGSLVFYVITLSTIVSALLLPIVGAAADRSAKKKNIMAGFAWAGSIAAAGLFFVTGTNWQLGVALLFVANICLGASLVVYDAILCQIAAARRPGPGLLPRLGARLPRRRPAARRSNLALVIGHDTFGLSTGMAVRVSMLSAAIWWAVFTLIPFLGHPQPRAGRDRAGAGRAGARRASASCGRR